MPAKAHIGAVMHLLLYLARSKDFLSLTRRAISGLHRHRQVHGIIHGDAGQRSDHLQGETAGADRTVHIRGRTHGGSSDNDGGGVLLQHLELGFDESFGSVPLYINNTLELHVTGNRTYSPRVKHIALR